MRPKLSIIVPYIRDEASFETTLVSILENRPARCEVIVPHDGSYADPFHLSDEVDFVVAHDETSLIGLLDAAVREARGSLVHVISEGIRATDGWTMEPVQLFESAGTGAVAPVVHDLARPNRIVAAGWTTDRKTIYRPLGVNQTEVSASDYQQVMGPFLCASFWRRDCLAACLEAGVGHCPQAAQLAIGYAMNACQIDCRVSGLSHMLGTACTFAPPSSGSIARDAQTVRMAATQQGAASSVMESFLGLLSSAGTSAGWKRTAGRLVAALMGTRDAAAVRQQLRIAQEMWTELDGPSHCVLPINRVQQIPTRRAA